MFSDIIFVFFIYLTTSIWTLVAAPFIYKLVGKQLPDGGWGLTTITGWLMLGVPVWFLGHLGIPINTRMGIYLVCFTWIVLLLKLNKSKTLGLSELFKSKTGFIVLEEVLFLFGFITMSLIRGFKPDILDLEKFMDAGFMMVYLTHNTLPAPDMWLAGYSINYYTFGHFLGAVATHFWGQPLAISYNLILGLICGLTLKGSASAVINLAGMSVKKYSTKVLTFSSVIAALLVTFGGNSHKAWYWFSKGSFKDYWYPDATRFIYHTIHEFPAYSFVVSDLHAHVFSLVLIILYVNVLLIWFMSLEPSTDWLSLVGKNSRAVYSSIAVGSLLGLIASTSTWDTMIAGLGLGILGVITLICNFKYFKQLLLAALLIGLSTFITASPWWLNFESISDGVRLVTTRTPIWQLGVLWGGHVLVVLCAVVVALLLVSQAKTKHLTFLYKLPWFTTESEPATKIGMLLLSLCTLAIVLIILPEIIYIKDIYPDHPRANTMFKLTFHSFVLMSLIGGWVLATAIQHFKQWKIVASLSIISVTILVTVASVYPVGAFTSYYGLEPVSRTYHGLDGLQWLMKQHPDDYQAIQWLLQQSEKKVIVEAVGESYTVFGRVSAFTGMPTILGWRVHEWLWRGSFDIPGARTTEVEKIYTAPQSLEVSTILSKYQVRYIFVGDKEREAYPTMNELGLNKLGTVVFRSGDTYIIERRVQ